MNADRPCPALFVTGTDTGVGKTLVTAGLGRYLVDNGFRVGVMKPVETGVADPGAAGSDAELLSWATRSADSLDLVAPYRLTTPVAPAQAAALERVDIEPELIADRLEMLAQDKDLVLLEGAGGLMVPIRGGFLVADLVKLLKLPLLVVARTGLGTLNHTLLTVFAARTMDIPVAGILLNGLPENPGPADREAARQLAMIASADILGVLPEVAGDDRQRIAGLAAEIGRLPTKGWLLKALGLAGMDGRF